MSNQVKQHYLPSQLIATLIIIILFISSHFVYATPATNPPPYIPNDFENAVIHNELSQVEDMLSRGADIEGQMNDGYPLKTAIRSKQYQMIKLLIAQGANVNDKKGSFSPLHIAVNVSNSKHDPDIVALLLANGADVNHLYNDDYPGSNEQNITPIFLAMENVSMVKQLIDAGANIHQRTPDGDTLVSRAVYARNIKSTELLLKLGTPVNLNQPLLHRVVSDDYTHSGAGHRFDNQKQMIQILLNAGYRINSRNAHDEILLWSAMRTLSYTKNTDIIAFLLAKGANPNLITNGENIAHRLAASNSLSPDSDLQFELTVFKLLLDYHVDINALTPNQKTPLDILRQHYKGDDHSFKEIELVKYLRNHRAKFAAELAP